VSVKAPAPNRGSGSKEIFINAFDNAKLPPKKMPPDRVALIKIFELVY
tara:strand:+ start:58 stop:201 length:144 start_codon:yes stop_codon:yes gene_type:complete